MNKIHIWLPVLESEKGRSSVMIGQHLGVALLHYGNKSQKEKVTGFFFVYTCVHQFVRVQVHAHTCGVQTTVSCVISYSLLS